MRILVVDNDYVFVEMMKSLIELTGGHEVVGVAHDLNSALMAAKDQQPDLALVDIGLAHHSTGYSVASELLKQDIPSVFVTGLPPPFSMPELALGCLAKPFGVDELRDLLEAVEARKSGSPHSVSASQQVEIYE